MSKEGLFQINLPVGYILTFSTTSPTSAVELDAEFKDSSENASGISISKTNIAFVHQNERGLTDDQIAVGLLRDNVASSKTNFASKGFSNFVTSDIKKQMFGSDTAYTYSGSVAASNSKSPSYYLEFIEIFNKNHGYEVFAVWPSPAVNSTKISQSLATFRASN